MILGLAIDRSQNLAASTGALPARQILPGRRQTGGLGELAPRHQKSIPWSFPVDPGAVVWG